jgi:hypothetical protein
MACPYFEPQNIASPATHPGARLPLIDEYDGLCHAGEASFLPAAAHRFRHCNHGNVQGGECSHFPAGDVPGCMRYQVEGRGPLHLELLIIEERQHWPHAWQRVQFEISGEIFRPPLPGQVVQAQALAFCRSYLKRFAA